MSSFRTLDQADVRNMRVLLRVDLNVPMENGKVADTTRIERVVPTITEIADRGGKVILVAPRSPKGPDPKESLRPVAATVADIIGRPIAFAEDCIGPKAETAVAAMKPGDILCVENSRFHKGEEKNDPAFVAALVKLGDLWVNDAFSAPHRAHDAYAGRSMQAELDALEKAPEKPARPLAASSEEDFDQARSPRQPYRQGRCADHQRRDGQHFPRRAGQAVGIAVRA